MCEPCAIFLTSRQSNETSASMSAGEPVARCVQLRALKRPSPLCAPLNAVDSSESSARRVLTQNTPALLIALCVVVALLMHASRVGGSAVTEHTAVAVIP